ncbi:hypothetical protein C8R45DRAFT_1105994 [Mycena sanguinolenta]|nr:hypothetical protein C8R45DRAFT_1105994 [Mycena sanguinolenta]
MSLPLHKQPKRVAIVAELPAEDRRLDHYALAPPSPPTPSRPTPAPPSSAPPASPSLVPRINFLTPSFLWALRVFKPDEAYRGPGLARRSRTGDLSASLAGIPIMEFALRLGRICL